MPFAPNIANGELIDQPLLQQFVDAINAAGYAPPRCVLRKNVVQSVPNAAVTAITWNAEDVDTHNMHSIAVNTSRLTIPAGFSGVWQVWASLAHSIHASDLWFLVNGAGNRFGWTTDAGGTATSLSAVIPATAGQYIELFGYQASGAAQNWGVAANLFDGFGACFLGGP